MMKKRFLPLIGALLLLTGLASVALVQGQSADTGSTARVSSPATAPAEAPVEPSAQDVQSAAEQSAQPANSGESSKVITGCGKPTPCPDRSCEDCPRNIYLR
jgi:TolA-binding protein